MWYTRNVGLEPASGRSSIGRMTVSKTVGCRFESCRPCMNQDEEKPSFLAISALVFPILGGVYGLLGMYLDSEYRMYWGVMMVLIGIALGVLSLRETR